MPTLTANIMDNRKSDTQPAPRSAQEDISAAGGLDSVSALKEDFGTLSFTQKEMQPNHSETKSFHVLKSSYADIVSSADKSCGSHTAQHQAQSARNLTKNSVGYPNDITTQLARYSPCVLSPSSASAYFYPASPTSFGYSQSYSAESAAYVHTMTPYTAIPMVYDSHQGFKYSDSNLVAQDSDLHKTDCGCADGICTCMNDGAIASCESEEKCIKNQYTSVVPVYPQYYAYHQYHAYAMPESTDSNNDSASSTSNNKSVAGGPMYSGGYYPVMYPYQPYYGLSSSGSVMVSAPSSSVSSPSVVPTSPIESSDPSTTDTKHIEYTENNIYIRGLSQTATDEDLIDMCSEYGAIISSKSIVDLATGQCKGYGFVMFEQEDSVEKAISCLTLEGYHVVRARMGPRNLNPQLLTHLRDLEDQDSTNVYVSNLPVGLIEAGLAGLFDPAEFHIESCKIMYHRDGRSRGAGFVKFSSRLEAVKAISLFDGYTVPGTQNTLRMRFADSQAQKRIKKRLESHKHANKSGRNSAMSSYGGSPAMTPVMCPATPFNSPAYVVYVPDLQLSNE